MGLRRAVAPVPLLLAAASGVLSGLTHPNASLLVLLPVALVPLLAALRGAGPGRGALVGELFGTAFWLTTVPWIAFTVHRYGEVPAAVAGLAIVVVAVLLALPFAAMGAALGWADARGGSLAWLFPAAWVAQEALRTHLFGGFPWALLAAPLADVPPLAQSAAAGGVHLTSGLVALLNVLLFLALTGDGREAAERGGGGATGRAKRRIAAAASALLLVAGAWGAGRARLAALDRTLADSPAPPPLRVALLQPAVSQELRASFEARDRLWAGLLEQTRRAAAEGRPDLVLWPESASPWQWPWSAGLRQELPALCREIGSAILFNTVWSDSPSDDEAPFYNSALLVTAAGPVLPPYHKQRLVPFGEYVPLGALLRRIRPISRAVPSSFTPGESTVVVPFRGWGLGGAVCYEVVYPWIAREEARQGATLLFTLTNDSWYGTAGARRQHWQGAVYRSIETGLPLLRAAVTGITGAVDAGGRSRTIPVDVPGTMLVELGSGPGRLAPAPPPPALRLGGAFPAVCVAVLLAGILRRRAFPPRGPGADADALRTSPAEEKAEP